MAAEVTRRSRNMKSQLPRTVDFHTFCCSPQKDLQLPFGRVGTRFISGGLALNRLKWKNHKAAEHDPYWRLYLPVSGEIRLHFSGEKYQILPGNLYLIPPEMDFRLEGIRPCSHYWCHFLCPSLNFMPGLAHPVFLADPEGRCRLLMRRLLKLALHAETFQDSVEMQNIPVQLTAMILDAQHASPVHAEQDREMEFAEILQFIEENLPTQIRIHKLAALSGHPLAVFTALFRKVTGMPPKQYISLRRINRAKQLLASTDNPVKQIAQNTGFPSIDLFYRLFKKYALCTPEEYRRSSQVKTPNKKKKTV